MKNIRVKYIKDGKAKYISHLDMNRCMTRCLQGAHIPLWHTEGFNPHPVISILLPLGVGVSSECELMDFQLTEPADPDAMPAALRATDSSFRLAPSPAAGS